MSAVLQTAEKAVKKWFLDFKWLQNSLIIRGQFEQLRLYMSVFHSTFNNAFVPSDCLNLVIFIAVPGAGQQHRLSLIQVFSDKNNLDWYLCILL